MPAVLDKSSRFTEEILKQIKQLDDDYDDGFLTKKGFFIKKWQLLKTQAGANLIEDVDALKEKFESKKISEDEYYKSFGDILDKAIEGQKTDETVNDKTEEPMDEDKTKEPMDEDKSKEPMDEAKTKETKDNSEDENTKKDKYHDIYSSPTPGPSRMKTPKGKKSLSASKSRGDGDIRRSSRKSTGPDSNQQTISSMFTSPAGKKSSKPSNKDSDDDEDSDSPSSSSPTTANRKSPRSAIKSDQEKEKKKPSRKSTKKDDVEDKENENSDRRTPKGSKEKKNGRKSKSPKRDLSDDDDDKENVFVDNNKTPPSSKVKSERKDTKTENDVEMKEVSEAAEKRKSDGIVTKIEESDDEDIDDKERVSKKVKSENDNIKPKKKLSEPKVKNVAKKCDICFQYFSENLKMYEGHPNNAVEEYVALTDPSLCLFTGEETTMVVDYDERPNNKITNFSIYDKAGHLCPFDTGLVERNVLLYFSGYVKPIYEEDPSIEGGVPTFDMGPINEWWITGFDGGEKALVGFSTAYGEYYLMEPSPDYSSFMEGVKEKMYLGKLVIEFLLDEENPSFEDLLNRLQTTVPPPGIPAITEDSLLKHAQFICDQVLSFEAASDSNDTSYITTPCMRSLVHLAGVTFGKRQAMRRGEKKLFKEKKPTWSKATTTRLVNSVFETFFTDQLDKDEETKGPKRMRCGVCEACQMADCGTCIHCRNMVKFGGSGKSKQACLKRRCPNMAVQEADDSEPEDEDSYQQAAEEMAKSEVRVRSARAGGGKKKVTWIGKCIIDDGRRVFYTTAKVGNDEISVGDYVSVEPVNPTTPLVIGKILYMWENKFTQRFMHVHWFMRGSETVLGETADPQELFVVDECENSLLSGIYSKVTVTKKERSETWADEGGKSLTDNTDDNMNKDDKVFYYQKSYNEVYGRFEDIPPEPERPENNEHRFCPSCDRLYRQQKFENPSIEGKIESEENSKEVQYELVRWRGEEYTTGCCVYLSPTTFKFKTHGNVFKPSNRKGDKDIDENLYPEFYRKSSDHVKGSNLTTPAPFCIGLITSVVTSSKDKLVAPADICIRVIKFYRPENTKLNAQITELDLNKLYASDEECVVNFGDVTGKCAVIYSENLAEDVYSWSKGGPNRFYFSEAYDSSSETVTEPSKKVKMLGDVGKGKGKGKGKTERRKIEIETWPNISRPLRCLDVFAGCGGLSEGLHQTGVAETLWAIEKEETAANAFRLNNPTATVFTEDCNVLLKLVMNGETKNNKGQKLPQKGEVELLVGGPPCQGFSGMNRFNSRQYSLFKNSLIVSYLAFCDYYRPRYFILENVRNFVSFKRSMVLKLTLRCLITMGYQVAFGILQAGNYGVPQTRRRLIIMAAAPGEVLPSFPEPMHVFNPRATQLSIMVDDKKLISNCQWVDSAPYRTITVKDAMSDLPDIRNGSKDEEMPYGGEPLSHFQKMMRGDQYQSLLKDHICKLMAPIVEARISHIPIASGSDWRDLPNIVVGLKDDTYTKKLMYTHHDKKNGKSSTGALRGVCACATGKPCDPMDRQFNTLIPWCLPHTGNRHNHWAGLYGRLEWDGFFSTTVTNPEPMGKQGRVLHPDQTRVVSVRECARSQGFPDKYRFYGNILDKHRQVGNAVPPPMGAAIGREIRKSVSIVEVKLFKENEEKMEIMKSII